MPVQLPELSPGSRRAVAIAAGAAVALAVPAVMGSAQVGALAQTVALAIGLLSLNVLLGYTGQISLGHAAFIGAGGFAAINIAGRLPLDETGTVGLLVEVVLSVAGAGLAVGLLTTVIGLPALRIRGLQVAIATLAFGVVAQTYLFTRPWFTGGSSGLSLTPVFGRGQVYVFWVLVLLALAGLVVVDRRLLGTQFGRALVAVRDGEERAPAFGVAPGPAKLRAYALSGVMAGVAGGISTNLSGGVDNTDQVVIQSLVLLSYVVLGGIGSRAGVLAVAFLLLGVQNVGLLNAVPVLGDVFTGRFIPLVSGLLLILIVLFLPTGYGGMLDDQRRLWRRLPVPARAGAVVAGGIGLAVVLVREQGYRSDELAALGQTDGAPVLPLVLAVVGVVVGVVGYLLLLLTDPGDAPEPEVGGTYGFWGLG